MKVLNTLKEIDVAIARAGAVAEPLIRGDLPQVIPLAECTQALESARNAYQTLKPRLALCGDAGLTSHMLFGRYSYALTYLIAILRELSERPILAGSFPQSSYKAELKRMQAVKADLARRLTDARSVDKA